MIIGNGLRDTLLDILVAVVLFKPKIRLEAHLPRKTYFPPTRNLRL